ncbi:hypothetical protein G3I60_43315 [Streptomyces sp. SID13666]|uniref:hypothetical protein n=1 Tax=unclassified Streptomyces TaxID=2593676 RepID=UPI0013C25972|nr:MULTISPECIES: hypothetical protein [unclassified Streptomyces]NEA60813.1 hypothetical protein [Streptomyces sp. SID13666]NEA73780.1 hypothetical protein [Streptomyces sp. SID13588]
MPTSFVDHTAIIDAIMNAVSRSTLPFQRAAHRERHFGTAFWFNDLLETTPDGDVVRQYLVTAGALTRYDLAEVTLRAELCDPEMSAEKLLMTGFADGWEHYDDLGVAVLPAEALHAHGERKGWRWTTDEITDGLAAGEQDIAAIGTDPVPAYILGHDVDASSGARLQAVVVGNVARVGSGSVRWDRTVPDGCAGAPVFIGIPLGEGRIRLVCLGAVLPGRDRNVIATFDQIRRAVRGGVPSPSRKRNGWKLRRR